MAFGAQPIRAAAGAASAALVLCLTFGTLAAVLLRAEAGGSLGTAERAAIRFTLIQATLSAVLSILLAIPVARALARRRFPGRALVITLLGAPFILPTIVAVLGLLAVFGRSGLLSAGLGALELDPIRIYGLHGVVLAHVFFNLPLAVRFFLHGWLAIPAERLRLAASLGFGPLDMWRHLEWPMLRGAAPGAFLVIFLICTTSFAVALTLGGGPGATTVELAIYQAFRFDFDLGQAAILAVVQFAIGAGAAILAFRVAVPAQMGAGLDRAVMTPPRGRGMDALVIALAVVFLGLPLVMIVLRGIPAIFFLPDQVWWALGRSVVVALCSTVICLALALPLAMVTRMRWGRVAEGIGYLAISASPLVIGTGAFIVIFPIANPVTWALAVTAVVNAVMALPFALRAIAPGVHQAEDSYAKLAASLNIRGWAWMRLVILPRIRRPLGFAAGLAAALSMGDLGVVALFADAEHATLPLQLYRLMGAYRTDHAAGAALLLLLASLSMFWIFDKGGRGDAGA